MPNSRLRYSAFCILYSVFFGPTILFALAVSAGQAPTDITARFNHAVDLQRRGELAAAETTYRALLALAPGYAEAHANLGAVLMRLDRYEEAVACYEAALRIAPGLGPVRLNLGIAHYRRGEFERAVPAFQRFLETDPSNLQATQLLGLALVELGRDREALPVLAAAEAAAPSEPSVLYGLALASLRLERADVNQLIGRLAAAPGGQAASHLLQGQYFLKTLEFERAVAELQTAAGMKPDLPRLYYSLGLSFVKLGRNKEALAAFEEEARRRPRDFSSLFYLAYLHETTGNLKLARSKLDAALGLEPESAEANALLGKILVKQDKAVEAVKPLEAAVAKNPAEIEHRYLLARVYRQLGRREDADHQFAEIQRLKKEQLEKDRARLK
jgi:tetratricopeptide (TPR) repeat protein